MENIKVNEAQLRPLCRRFVCNIRKKNNMFYQLYQMEQTDDVIDIEVAYLLSQICTSNILMKYDNCVLGQIFRNMLLTKKNVKRAA